MRVEYQLILTATLALAGGLTLSLFIFRQRTAAAVQKIRSELMPELATLRERLEEREKSLSNMQGHVQETEEANRELEQERNELDKQLAVAMEKARRAQILENELHKRHEKIESLQVELQHLSGALAKETEKAEQVEVLSRDLAAKEQTIDALQQQGATQKATIAELNTRIEEERKQAEEKLALLNEARTELTHQFKSLAQDIFEEKGKTFTEQNRNKLDALLTPFREQITDFRKKVDDVYVHEAKERASLKQELEHLRQLNRQINQEAVNLTRALKGDKKVQGNWGEMILERVLEQSGLRKGEEYETQGGFRDSDNRLLKPDVIIHLPEGKDVVIDSKVSLADYERYSSSEEETVQAEALKNHVRAIRNHIDTLSGKDYASLKGLRSLDFVLMFIPIEAAFMAAFQHDEKLFSDAFRKKIVVVTPTTLLATLRTIENIWRYERQNQNAQAIANRAGAIYDKLRGFVEDMEKLGKQISTVNDSYEGAMNKLTRGRGNLINQATQFVNLGVKVKKTIPKSITETAEIEAPDAGETDRPDILN